ncbi:DUF4097 family beta strand repeat-containing protein [Enterococcus pingfangensis]|uniref:DUF4097 family beta strand repeat-containing protein n=1 Tax=Enterococcus pingfangensis TaxID=2559924 RepID=UPI0010F84C5E|nr:DUF4097 family beta strand repeat-containing protein [Enterococcus pingfangensis]
MKKIVAGLVLIGAALVGMISLSSQRVSNKIFTTEKSVKQLIVEDRDMPIEIIGVSGDQTRIKYNKSRDIKYKIKQTGNTLDMERKKVFGFNFNFFDFGRRESKVTVEVPKAELSELQVETSNSRILVEDLALDQLDLETNNSKLRITNVDAETVDAETSNGEIDLAKLAFNEGDFETSNGKINLEDLDFVEGDFQTSNGKINLTNVKPAESVLLATSNAKVTGTIVGDQADFSTQAKTSNASNSLTNQTSGAKELTVKTSNGDIAVTFIQ